MNCIYRAEFISPLDSGAGTLYLDGNTFYGGDYVMLILAIAALKMVF